MSPPAPLATPLVALLTLAVAEISKDPFLDVGRHRQSRDAGPGGSSSGCLYEGHWHSEGLSVPTRWACLRCACSAGALWCRRRPCRPPPVPLPPACRVLHRPDACCPELHCPDGVTVMEYEAATSLDVKNRSDIATPATPAIPGHGAVSPACVEGGVVFGAGSALGGGAACELCFCLGARRRCVAPRCLPPPPGCVPGPTRGSCCPNSYDCNHSHPLNDTATHRGPHDCEVGGQWVIEGERVPAVELATDCTQCFCLRGAVRCQPLACAPPLRGCTPLVQPGHCCPHQYSCHHGSNRLEPQQLSNNPLTRIEDRSLHSAVTKPSKHNFTTKGVPPPTLTKMNKTVSATTKLNKNADAVSLTISNRQPVFNNSMSIITATEKKETKHDYTTIPSDQSATTNINVETTTTEQPEGSVRIVINESINCTAELSSTSLPLNISNSNTKIIKLQAQPRLPFDAVEIVEAQTFNPNEIITEGNPDGGYDENETFTVNVTTSLRTNNNKSASIPTVPAVTKSSSMTNLPEVLNITKKHKEDNDYDYTDPTLPPSLPNLKIIPFLAADAVVENKSPAKETIKYPALDREDKFPVYYSKEQPKDATFVTRRDGMFHTTQHPVFTQEKNKLQHYPALTQEIDIAYLPSHGISNDLLGPANEFTVSSSIGNKIADRNIGINQVTSTRPSLEMENHSINLFSPPSETEGGFVPKGPEVAEEYYSVYSSTPSGPSIPHLTTSMQLDTNKGNCISEEGNPIAEGGSKALGCSVCICVWGEMQCSPKTCHTPPGCKRLADNNRKPDLCCGELICERVGPTSLTTTLSATTVKTYTKVVNKSSSVKNKTQNLKSESGLETIESIGKNVIKHGMENVTFITNIKNTENLEVTDASKAENATEQLFNTTEKESTLNTTVVPTLSELHQTHTSNYSQEYEYDEDEGFSLGSVLQLLLGDRYDTTTASTLKRKTTTLKTKLAPSTMQTMTIPLTTTKKPPLKSSLTPFIPIRLHNQYTPPKKTLQENAVNRIDHLILGEATQIKNPTPRPIATTALLLKPITTSVKPATNSKPTSVRPVTLTVEEPHKEEEKTAQYSSVVHEGSRLPGLPAGGFGAGILKLAGCNIYGRMYRVGRIIAELSSPCQECRCTELGVQCTSLNCSKAD